MPCQSLAPYDQVEWEQETTGIYLAGTKFCIKLDGKDKNHICDLGNTFWLGPDCNKDDDLFLASGSHLTTCKGLVCASADEGNLSIVRCTDPAAQGWSQINTTVAS